MPRQSERARIIQGLHRALGLLDDAARLEPAYQIEAEEVHGDLQYILAHRYLDLQRAPEDQRTRDSHRRCVQHLSWSEDDFKRAFRVTKGQFWDITAEISADEIFRRGSRGPGQRPVEHQVLLVLWRLEHSRTGAGVFHVAERFGVAGEQRQVPN